MLVMCVYIHDEMCSLTCIVKNGDGEGSCGCCKSPLLHLILLYMCFRSQAFNG